jgi:transposase-like protein
VLAEKHEKPASRIARELGVSEKVLHRWMRRPKATADDRPPAFPGHGRPRDEEPARLRKEAKA